MRDILIRARTFDRIGERLRAHEGKVRPLTLDENGLFFSPWEGREVETPQPAIAFGNIDVWFRPKRREFIETVMATPRLEWFQSGAAGIENPVLAGFGRKAEIYTTCHTQSEAMAEWALWAAFDFFRKGPEHRAAQAGRSWERIESREVAGSKWLVVGFGSIGKAIGWRVKALGGHVTGVRRSGGEAAEADRIVEAVTPEELGAADVVLLCLPHTPETEGVADGGFFAAMKRDALFMNLGRGKLVDESALLAALDAGRPAFAALDVVATEPLPEDSPIWRHPKIMLTPHNSPATPGSLHRSDDLFLENLGRFLDGGPMLHVADRSLFD